MTRLLNIIARRAFLPRLFGRTVNDRAIKDNLNVAIGACFVEGGPPFNGVNFCARRPVRAISIIVRIIAVSGPVKIITFIP